MFFYHIILALFVGSYFKTIFSPACATPAKWKLSTAMVEKLNKAKSEQGSILQNSFSAQKFYDYCLCMYNRYVIKNLK
jgi:hypothetical protein